MVGKTGNGKSALGNSILRKESFHCDDDMSSVTKETRCDYSQFEDTILKVVDGPGLGDTALDKKEGIQLVMDAMSFAIRANPGGYHAILIVVRYGQRFTKEDVKTLTVLKQIFGESLIRDHAILVMTCGDVFSKNAKRSKKTFQQWCEDQKEENFRKLLSEVGNRVVLFDNMTEDENKRSEQIRQLLVVIDDLSSHGMRYNFKNFEKAKKSQDAILVSADKIAFTKAASKEADLITQQSNNIDSSQPEKEHQRLNNLRARAKALLLRVQEQDRETGVLSSTITMVKNIEKSLVQKMQHLTEIIDQKERMRETQRRKRQEEIQHFLRQSAREERRRAEETERREMMSNMFRADHENTLRRMELDRLQREIHDQAIIMATRTLYASNECTLQ